MAKKVICYKCAKEFELIDREVYWLRAEHLPFDTLQNLKNIINDNNICEACLQSLHKNTED